MQQYEIRAIRQREWHVYDLTYNRIVCKCLYKHQAEELFSQLIRITNSIGNTNV